MNGLYQVLNNTSEAFLETLSIISAHVALYIHRPPPYAYLLRRFMTVILASGTSQAISRHSVASPITALVSNHVVLHSKTTQLEKNGMVLIAITCVSDA